MDLDIMMAIGLIASDKHCRVSRRSSFKATACFQPFFTLSPSEISKSLEDLLILEGFEYKFPAQRMVVG